ncbi:MAG: phosphatidate cytidylyltransferase [Pseudomonadota bacterium]
MELLVRVISALVFAPAMLAIVWYADEAQYAFFVAALGAVGGWEWGRLAGSENPATRALLGALVAGAVLALVLLADHAWTPIVISLGMLIWLLNLCWLAQTQFLSAPDGAARLIKLALGFMVLVAAATSLSRIHQFAYGVGLTIVFLLIIWAADVGAYAAGRLFGRHKLAPTISPGKTWEGVLGGQLLVAAACAALLRYLPEAMIDEVQLGAWLFLLAAVTAAISVVGDLFISVLKRQRQLKDTGRVIPGHGGILDRFDSAFAAAPFFLCGLLLTRW